MTTNGIVQLKVHCLAMRGWGLPQVLVFFVMVLAALGVEVVVGVLRVEALGILAALLPLDGKPLRFWLGSAVVRL